MSSTPPPTIGVIGCGAIAEMAHIPAFARHDDVRERMILIDRDEARARRVAGKFGVGRTATDYKDVIDDLDGAVVAVPHHLHVPITLDLVGAPAAADGIEIDIYGGKVAVDPPRPLLALYGVSRPRSVSSSSSRNDELAPWRVVLSSTV